MGGKDSPSLQTQVQVPTLRVIFLKMGHPPAPAPATAAFAPGENVDKQAEEAMGDSGLSISSGHLAARVT